MRPRRLAAFGLLLAVLTLPGCYVMHTALGQMDLNSRRVPIGRIVANPSTPDALRAKLEYATRARQFAVQALGLPEGSSYRDYADVGRPYVVWNVFATAEFSVDPLTWCFPVAGCVAYRGYFDERRARDFALSLESRGDDVAIGGVPAYSTLGHFADPVLNTMLRWEDPELAALIFHELAHQRVYVPGDTAFNESFASVVEREGLRRWLVQEGHASLLEAAARREAAYLEVAGLVAETRTRLRALYARDLPVVEKRAAKAFEFEHLRRAYTARRERLGGSYDAWFGAVLNNARLLSLATYQQCVPALEHRLEALGGDLTAFYGAARALAKLSTPARHAAVCGPATP